ncbi:MAG: hypothetical protein A2W86_07010 [Bacteroidetes bacterium GWD2_45_23]|nr:MAG: hypothetical protein A2W87_01790 [Bacteroidetes bacterium GWC2_46_850]OFX83007.1 MAG: hypothetical protein A2W86_07010 [Bacteroidetes bacterium GWD2_45_23]HBA99842.1 DUF3037 domain-containing protein [Porphyromonadaceae bacterium]HCC18067.1 DUF3037 domain-containing protein [Porphyromonadaceae bacterium]
MQEDKLYHYAVIRMVPKVEREEFFNIGLILFSKEAKYIRLATHVCPEKYRLMQAETDYEDVMNNLETLKQIAEGNKDCGPIALLDIPERFRWLTATRSSIIQTSPVHAGKTADLDKTFDRLFQELVI